MNDFDRVVAAIAEIIDIYDDSNREGVIDTPKRVAKAYDDLLRSEMPKLTFFDANGYDQMIVEKNVPFFSFCEHHILPFFGTCSVGYIPGKKIVGISKIARIIKHFASRLNTQEYFTQNIADFLAKNLDPIGVGVVVRGVHLCQVMRGAQSKGEMITSALTGVFREKQETRQEFLAFLKQ